MIFLVIDCHGLGYRAYHSLGGLSHDGTATGVAFGFLSTILRLGERYKTNKILFCWDGGDSVRRKIYPAYKIGCKTVSKTPEEQKELKAIHAQFDSLRDTVLPALGFKNLLIQTGYEADDIIAYLIAKNVCQGIVVSSDHDLYQLLQYPNCRGQHMLSTDRLTTANSFHGEYRITAREWAMVKAIAGCGGDGVPGIPGVAEKTAIRYILDELPDGKKKRDIDSNFKLIQRNWKLVRLPIHGVNDIQVKEDDLDEENILQIFSDLGFSSFTSDKQAERWRTFCRGIFK
jgi:DNA polymerase-1